MVQLHGQNFKLSVQIMNYHQGVLETLIYCILEAAHDHANQLRQSVLCCIPLCDTRCSAASSLPSFLEEQLLPELEVTLQLRLVAQKERREAMRSQSS